jgi:hypothetical protein
MIENATLTVAISHSAFDVTVRSLATGLNSGDHTFGSPLSVIGIPTGACIVRTNKPPPDPPLITSHYVPQVCLIAFEEESHQLFGVRVRISSIFPNSSHSEDDPKFQRMKLNYDAFINACMHSNGTHTITCRDVTYTSQELLATQFGVVTPRMVMPSPVTRILGTGSIPIIETTLWMIDLA